MSKVKDWEAVYKSGQESFIRTILKAFYAQEDWEELHVALWTWLSLNRESEKWDWFEKFGVPRVSNYCFACKMAGNYCCCCPITKPEPKGCLNGLYDQWWEADFETRESLAERIANMKWLY